MTNKHTLYIIITMFSFFTYIGNIEAQFVYPGDTNLDSIVNNIDVLYLGKAHGETGAARSSVSISWDPIDIPSPPWTNTIYGTPAHFSDCDGNGMVGNEDIEAIQFNYGLQYGSYIPVGEGEGPILRIEAEEDTIGMGDEMLFRVLMGSDTEIFEDVEGIAYTLRMGSNFSNFELFLDFSDDNNWFINMDEQLHLLQIEPLVSFDVANTRIDQTGQDGFGEVARLSANIDKDLIGGMIDDYTPFEIEVENIIVSYSDRIDTIQGSKDTIYISLDNNTTPSNDIPSIDNINITPNPFSSIINMTFEEKSINEVKIVDVTGRLLFIREVNSYSNHLQIPTEEWPPGIYIIQCSSKQATYNEVLIKQ